MIRLLLIIAGMLGGQAFGQADDQAAIDSIKKNGGLVLPSSEGENQWDIQFQLRGRDLTDAGLADVAKLGNVVELNLRDTKITSDGLVHLKGLAKLTRLHLERTNVGDEGIANLARLNALEYLNLYGTKITDKSLDHLAGLKKLRQLYIWQTDVTDDGIAELKKALPAISIEKGIELTTVIPVKKEEPKPEHDLKWLQDGGDEKPPAKSITGEFTIIRFINKRDKAVKLFWIDYGGKPMFYGIIEPGDERRQNTYEDAVWMVADQRDMPLGYFVTGREFARAIIPR
ncbi:MAG: hypothetical protein QGG00_09955 [Verrucomicrobiota bacterium]|jgi:hypothetical protein|nr:hypothetical protein [Verrucomicrobiota bacterium]